jgi:hypothetical protein
MSEHGIPFCREMVQAIGADLKTQTRRLPSCTNCLVDGRRWNANAFACLEFREWALLDNGHSPAGNPGPYLHVRHAVFGTTHRVYPLYQVGDRLWVRETWRPHWDEARLHTCCQYKADLAISEPDFPDLRRNMQFDREALRAPNVRWKSGRFMPKWVSRLLLEVLAVRWQRIQDISEEDAIAEGIERPTTSSPKEEGWRNYLWHGYHGRFGMGNKQSQAWPYQYSNYRDSRDSFSSLWELINSKRAPWESNPWVLAITFKSIVPAAPNSLNAETAKPLASGASA